MEAVKAIKNGKQPQKQSGKTLRTFPRKPEDSKLDFNASLNQLQINKSSSDLSVALMHTLTAQNKSHYFQSKPYLVEYDFMQ